MVWWCVWYIIVILFHTLYPMCQNLFIIIITFPLSHAIVTSQHFLQDAEFCWTTFISDSLWFAMNLWSSLKMCADYILWLFLVILAELSVLHTLLKSTFYTSFSIYYYQLLLLHHYYYCSNLLNDYLSFFWIIKHEKCINLHWKQDTRPSLSWFRPVAQIHILMVKKIV